jgi:hypothetical protein
VLRTVVFGSLCPLSVAKCDKATGAPCGRGIPEAWFPDESSSVMRDPVIDPEEALVPRKHAGRRPVTRVTNPDAYARALAWSLLLPMGISHLDQAIAGRLGSVIGLIFGVMAMMLPALVFGCLFLFF